MKRRLGAPRRTEPREVAKVRKIIRLREVKNLTWREIGERLSESHQGPYLLYKKWRKSIACCAVAKQSTPGYDRWDTSRSWPISEE
jgi:hypothetical protein